MKQVAFKTFANGIVYALETSDGFPVEVTDTFLPYSTKNSTNGNNIANTLSDRTERWMIGVSCMSGCPVKCRFCFEEKTPILMSNFTYKLIKDIKIGDKVICNIKTKASNSFSEYATDYSTIDEVSEIFTNNYNGNMIRIYTESGNIFDSTENHPIAIKKPTLYRKKFIPAKKAEVGDFIVSSPKKLIKNESWELGWVWGFIEGDGIFTKNTNKDSYKWIVSQTDKTVLEYCFNILNYYKIKTTKIWTQKNKNYSDSYRFSFGENSTKLLKELIQLHENTDMFKKGYIAGFWDAEGYSFKNNNSTKMCNTNIVLLEKIITYINSFGFTGIIKKYNSFINRVNTKTKLCYVLETNINRINFIFHFCPISEKKLFLNHSNKIKSLCDLDKISKIEKYWFSGVVYNFETKINHNYYASNILSHNCATGQLKKWRNLTADEIVEQVVFVIKNNPDFDFAKAKEHKINYTRMGEPGLNIVEVKKAIEIIEKLYPNTHHYISTIGITGFDTSWIKDNITLQISVHSLDDNRRNQLIPFKNKVTIKELGEIRTKSNLKTTVNLTLVDEEDFDILLMKKYFDPAYFFIKLSPVNTNCVSESNHIGNGIIEAENLI